MTTAEQERVDDVVRTRPPAPDAALRGWVLLADWSTGEGQDLVTVMGSPDAHIVFLKGIVHEGLYDIARGVYRVASGYVEDVRSPAQAQ